jgi:GTPase SAR1 family protein
MMNIREQATNKSLLNYATAKMLIVGESGVGKTDLALCITAGKIRQDIERNELHCWLIENLDFGSRAPQTYELFVWDLPSRPDYRLIHPLLIADVDLALIVIDPTKIRESHHIIDFWMAQLMHRREDQCPTILVGTRIDRGTATLRQEDLTEFCTQHNITGGYIGTSARTGEGITELINKIASLIKWQDITTNVPQEFSAIKQFVLSLKANSRRILMTPTVFQREVNKNTEKKLSLSNIESALHVLKAHGHVILLQDSRGKQWILLNPNLLVKLASSFVDEARRNTKGLGALQEEYLLQNKYPFPELQGVSSKDAKILVDATTLLFIERNLCFRETLNNQTFLVFPTLIQEKRPKITDVESIDDVSYKITGAVDTAYAMLVVLLGYTTSFIRTHQWENQAQYELDEGEICGFRQIVIQNGESDLVLYYAKNTPEYAKPLFQGYFEKFLGKRDVNIVRYQPVTCKNKKCNERLDRNIIIESLDKNLQVIFCNYCGSKVILSNIKTNISKKTEQNVLLEKGERFTMLRTKFESALTPIKRLLEKQKVNNPTCFISYSWGVPEHERWVLQLAKDLRNAGINVLLDRWHNPPGTSLTRFIDKILASDFVIVVGTPKLREKYDTHSHDPVVAAELRLINTRLRKPSKYGSTVIPVLLAGNFETSFAPLIQDIVAFDFSIDESYFVNLLNLIWRLYEIPFDNPLLEELQKSITIEKES